ncbi:hypothetical protein [uncultured Hydrogenophaga sp.]|uniref:thiolase family protein n=1 Tax=uncultured Hydrogenophaga sp. TaxID=199683 RepID=UPI00258A028C|nr:hypothetical protein [uncultured Hydrogenophaga sp.]
MSNSNPSPKPTATHEVWILDSRRTPLDRPGGALGDLQPAALLAVLIDALQVRSAETGLPDPDGSIDTLVLGCASEGGVRANTLPAALARAGAPALAAASLIEGGSEAGAEALRLAVAALRGGEARLAMAGGLHLPARTHGHRGPSPDVLGALAALTVSPRTAADVATSLHAIDAQDLQVKLEAWRRAGPPDPQAVADGFIVPVRDLNGLCVLADDDIGGAAVAREANAPAGVSETRSAQHALARQAWPDLGDLALAHPAPLDPPPLQGAGLVLLGRADAARTFGLRPRARWVASAAAGHRTLHMVQAAVGAIDDALARAGWRRSQLDCLAVAGRFRGVPLALAKALGLDDSCLIDGPEGWWHGDAGALTPVLALERLLRHLERAGQRRGALVCPGETGACVVVLVERGDHA